jgi:hypothetical protein
MGASPGTPRAGRLKVTGSRVWISRQCRSGRSPQAVLACSALADRDTKRRTLGSRPRSVPSGPEDVRERPGLREGVVVAEVPSTAGTTAACAEPRRDRSPARAQDLVHLHQLVVDARRQPALYRPQALDLVNLKRATVEPVSRPRNRPSRHDQAVQAAATGLQRPPGGHAGEGVVASLADRQSGADRVVAGGVRAGGRHAGDALGDRVEPGDRDLQACLSAPGGAGEGVDAVGLADADGDGAAHLDGGGRGLSAVDDGVEQRAVTGLQVEAGDADGVLLGSLQDGLADEPAVAEDPGGATDAAEDVEVHRLAVVDKRPVDFDPRHGRRRRRCGRGTDGRRRSGGWRSGQGQGRGGGQEGNRGRQRQKGAACRNSDQVRSFGSSPGRGRLP